MPPTATHTAIHSHPQPQAPTGAPQAPHSHPQAPQAQDTQAVKIDRGSLMASFHEDTQGPNEAPRVDKIQVWNDIRAVLEHHYLAALMHPDNDEAYTAWKIMQDVRIHLELTAEETDI